MIAYTPAFTIVEEWRRAETGVAQMLESALQAGIEQHFLITAEKELLKSTLTGSIKVITEILSIVNRSALSRAERVRSVVTNIVKNMELPDPWQYEVAAMLSQIGCLVLPTRLLEKVARQEKLTEEEETLYLSHPIVASKLLSKIPRLGAVSQMIEGQLRPFHAFPPKGKSPMYDKIALGSQILKASLDFDQLIQVGKHYVEVITILENRPDVYNSQVVAALKKLVQTEASKKGEQTMIISVKDVKIGMITDQDIVAKDGFLLVPKGHEITYPVTLLLRNYSRAGCVSEPFKVRVPREVLEMAQAQAEEEQSLQPVNG
jgi:hypothetical protein